jgi:hypothetical protein
LKKLFLVGCPRSGTTWLQIVLGSHPKISTVRETHLFDHYINDIYEKFLAEEYSFAKDGLRNAVTGGQLDELCRVFTQGVLDSIAAMRPGSDVVLEKTASHIWSTRLMRRLHPDAYFLHVIRDPRAVVSSILAYGNQSWSGGQPPDVMTAAKLWRSAVTIGHIELAQLGPQRIELRYEDMTADPEGSVARVLAALDLDPLPYDHEAFSISTLKKGKPEADSRDPRWENRENFFRRGTVDGWKSDLGPGDIAVIEALCGDLMAQLGYATSV